MHLTPTILVSLAAIALARPQGAATASAGSKKNVYLATCRTRGLLTSKSTRQSTCRLEAPTDAQTGGSSSAVVYFNGVASSNKPTDVASVSVPARNWDGATRSAGLSGGRFTSNIEAGADDLPKSQLAGSATLGDEDLVCFVDGTSTFTFREGFLGLLGLWTTDCKADFWCASIEVGS